MQDLPSIILQTAKFLGKELTQDQVSQLTHHLSFEQMSKNPAVNYEDVVSNMRNLHGTFHDSKFMRKGQVGSYKEEMTPEMLEKFDKWSERNRINGLYDN